MISKSFMDEKNKKHGKRRKRALSSNNILIIELDAEKHT